ncbi:MAG: DUF4097 family beta strand repeat protein, partial [Firmicutes bacterium]|nr:DUF4097 family beta strand repeat protein [Bacillota bacterium]
MKTATKIWLIIAAVLVIVGSVVFIGAMAASDWKLNGLDNQTFETNSYDIAEEFHSISVDTSTADIILKPSDSETAKVVCFEDRKTKHSVNVQEGTLMIHETDNRSWFDFISLFRLDYPEITIYLPESTYASLSAETDTGDIEIPQNFTFGNIMVTSDTGDITCCASAEKLLELETDTGSLYAEAISAMEMKLNTDSGDIMAKTISCAGNMNIDSDTGNTNITDITCKILTADSNTGDICMENVIAAEDFFLENDTGNIEMIDCDAAEIFAQTNTGE